jgi:hypothetical protein
MCSMAGFPRAALDGTGAVMWPGGTLTARGPVPHKSVLPIVRQALETQLLNALRAECTKVGAPFDLIRPAASWREEFTGKELVVTLTTKHAMVISKNPVRPPETARWVGGPRDGQEVPALNGEIVWDGPLAVVVRDKQVMWRDVGDGARAAWAEMSSEEREQFRRELEADADVTSSHDVEAPAPPSHLPDQLVGPMAEVITAEKVAKTFDVPASVVIAAEPPRFPRDGDIWIDTNF